MRVTIRERKDGERTVFQADIHVIPKGEDARDRFRLTAPPVVTSRSGAERWAMEEARRIAANGRPYGTKKAREARKARQAAEEAAKLPTFAEWAPLYLQFLVSEHRKPGTLDVRRTIITKHLVPMIGTLTLSECSAPQQIAQLKAGFFRIGPRRTNAVMGQLIHMLRVASERFPITVPTYVALKVPKRAALKHFSAAQCAHLIEVLKECPLRWQIIALLMLDCGLRAGEIGALRWDAVDFDRNEIDVRASLGRNGVIVTPKSGSSRTVPMSGRLRVALESQPKVADFVVFGTRELGPLPYTSLKGSWRAVLRRAKLPDLSPHKARHTFATGLLRTGTDLATVRDLLGHSFVQTTALYLHSDESTARGAIERLEAGGKELARAATSSSPLVKQP